MTRNLQYKIEAQHHGKRIDWVLKEKEFSRAVLIELKKDQKGIRKNGIWACVNELVQVGDILDICLQEEGTSENIVPIEGKLQILYEDEDILVVSKPYDTPIHPSVNNYENTLANTVMYYYERQGTPHTFRCINRLDRDTTGVTIIAKHLLSASILANRLQARAFSRVYVALVEGKTKEEGMIDLPIGRAEDSIIKRRIDEKEGKRAVTHYRRLEAFEVAGQIVSMVALKLETGRTHQIRVHMSAIGHPLLGDFLYNESDHTLTRQALHGAECEFKHPITGKHMHIVAPLPVDMERLIHQGLKLEEDRYDLAAKLNSINW